MFSQCAIFNVRIQELLLPEFANKIKRLSNEKVKSLHRQAVYPTIISKSEVLTAALLPDLPYILCGIFLPFFSTPPASVSQTSLTEFTFPL